MTDGPARPRTVTVAETALDGHASRALGWSFLNALVSRVGTLGVGIVLARLLGPKDFGSYAVAYVALVAVLAFNELGVSLAIVRWPGDPRAIASTVNAISTAASTLLCASIYLVAPWFSRALGDPAATPVVRVLGLSVIVSGAVAGPAALLQRDFRQRTRLLIDQVNVWIGAVVSIVLAAMHVGAMSLAAGRLAGAVTSGILFILCSSLPYRVSVNRAQVRPLLKFGLPLAVASILVFAVNNADQLVVGRTLGPTALGFYVLAFNLANWPLTLFSLPLRSVAPAIFARLRGDPPVMRRRFTGLVGVLAAVAFPACMFLAGASRPIVQFVYGHEWGPAAPALVWLAVLAAMKILFELFYDYLVVVGVSMAIMGLQLATLVTVVPAVILGAYWDGIRGVAAAQSLVATLVLLPLYLVRLRKVGVPGRQLIQRCWRPVVAALATVAAASALSRMVAGDVLSILASGLVALAAAVVLLHSDRDELRRLLAKPPPVVTTPQAATG